MPLRHFCLLALMTYPLFATDYVVDPSGGEDFSSISAALAVAMPGDRVLVNTGIYFENLTFPRNGTDAARIQLLAAPGQAPVIDGGGGDNHLINLWNRSNITISGFALRNTSGFDNSGVRIQGSGGNITVQDCVIHDMRGESAMGVTVYGTSESAALFNIKIERVTIYDCESYPSEALVFNGNITGFEVLDCLVRDINNIAMDFIGGETGINSNGNLAARNGLIRGNTVIRSRAPHGWGAGIYVDGAHDLIIEGNTVTQSDTGIEVGAENTASTTTNVVVRNNLVYGNDKAGIRVGAFEEGRGRVTACYILNNVSYHNDAQADYRGLAEMVLYIADNNVIANNIFIASDANYRPFYGYAGSADNVVNFNLYYSEHNPGTTEFFWNGTGYFGLTNFKAASGQAANSVWGDPQFVDAAAQNFHLRDTSPAVDAGDASFGLPVGDLDIDGHPRVYGANIDLGVDELVDFLCYEDILEYWGRSTQVACLNEVTVDVRTFIDLFNGRCACE